MLLLTLDYLCIHKRTSSKFESYLCWRYSRCGTSFLWGFPINLVLSSCSTLDDEGTNLRQQKLDRQVSLPLVSFQHCVQKVLLKGNGINQIEWTTEKTGRNRTMREKPFIEESHHGNIFSRQFKENAFDKSPYASSLFALHYGLSLQ